jgi:hypothetical protein
MAELKPPKHYKRSSSFISKRKKAKRSSSASAWHTKHMEIQYEADTVVFFPFLPRWRSVQTTEPPPYTEPSRGE